jgi:ABC-type sugar transport system ATPase subunit
VGAGRTNVAETIFGVTPATSGEIFVDGKKLTVDSPQTAMRAGMALLTEDRKDTGCFLVLSVLEHGDGGAARPLCQKRIRGSADPDRGMRELKECSNNTGSLRTYREPKRATSRRV